MSRFCWALCVLWLGAGSARANPGETPWLVELQHGGTYSAVDVEVSACVQEVWTNVMWGLVTILHKAATAESACPNKNTLTFTCDGPTQKCVYCAPNDGATCDRPIDDRRLTICESGGFVLDGQRYVLGIWRRGDTVADCLPVNSGA